MNLEDIHSSHVKRCVRCGIPITPANDSGWEVFVGDGKTTQPLCAWCDVEHSKISAKAPSKGKPEPERKP